MQAVQACVSSVVLPLQDAPPGVLYAPMPARQEAEVTKVTAWRADDGHRQKEEESKAGRECSSDKNGCPVSAEGVPQS